MTRWRAAPGDRVLRRWRGWLGVGTVEEVERGSARVRFETKWFGTLVLWCAPSHLTRPELHADAGPGFGAADLAMMVGTDRRGMLVITADASEAMRAAARGEGGRPEGSEAA